MNEVDGFQECQKIICSDGPCDIKNDYEVLEIKRPKKDYNWQVVWEAGVKQSKHDLVWYLDCDRVVPKNYLTLALKAIRPKAWVYPRQTFRINSVVNQDILLKIQEGEFLNLLEREPRVDNPPSVIQSQSGKNPFSGNIIFNKNEYLESGGLDANFEGYGYADIDYYMMMHKLGYKFVPVSKEYHQWHPHAVVDFRGKRMMYYNGLMYCKKWGLKPHARLLKNSIVHNLDYDRIECKSYLEFEKLESVKLL